MRRTLLKAPFIFRNLHDWVHRLNSLLLSFPPLSLFNTFLSAPRFTVSLNGTPLFIRALTQFPPRQVENLKRNSRLIPLLQDAIYIIHKTLGWRNYRKQILSLLRSFLATRFVSFGVISFGILLSTGPVRNNERFIMQSVTTL